ncbi:TPA: hypothetical protein ACF37B_004443 [Vibrio parahaemolyticus]
MSLEQQVTALVEASNKLTSAVNGKIGQIDQRMDQAEQETQAAIDRLNAGHLQTLIFTSNKAGIDLVGDTSMYRRFYAGFTGGSDGTVDKWITLLSDRSAYSGDTYFITHSSFQRGYSTGSYGVLCVRESHSDSSGVNSVTSIFIESVTSNAAKSDFRVVNELGEEVVPNETTGAYEIDGAGVKYSIQVYVRQYKQVNCLVDVIN